MVGRFARPADDRAPPPPPPTRFYTPYVPQASPTHARARRAQLVCEAGDEGHFGTDDREIDALLADKTDDLVVRVRGDRDALRVLCDPGIAGRGVKRRDERAPADRPRERVLAPAAAD